MPDIETYGGQCPQCLRPMLQKFNERASRGFNYDACPWCGHIQAEGVTELPDEYGPMTRHEAWQTLFAHLLGYTEGGLEELRGRVELILHLELSPEAATEERSDFWPSVFVYEHRSPEGNPAAVNDAEEMWAHVRMQRELLKTIKAPMDAAHGWTVTESVHPLPASVREGMERLHQEVLANMDQDGFVTELHEVAKRSRELASLVTERDWVAAQHRKTTSEALNSYAEGLEKLANGLAVLMEHQRADQQVPDPDDPLR